MTWDWRSSSISDYGGGSNKKDHREGAKPHAYGVYRFLQAAQGSAYSKEMSGLLHAENLTEARAGAAAMRAAEKLQMNSFPSRSDESLLYWVETLGVNVGPEDSDDDVRRKAQAKYQALNGNDMASVGTAVSTMLGPAFVAVHRNGNTPLSSPSEHTYWPGVNDGPVIYDLDGSGAWFSDNCHILIEYTESNAVNKLQLRRTVNVDLPDMLNDMLAAWGTFESSKDQCFLVGESGVGDAALCD